LKSRRRPKKSLGDFQQAGKKEGGLGEGIFARLPVRRRRTMGWESVSAILASAGRQNRKIFVSLIENNFGGARLKKCKENFSVLSAVRRTETLGGIQSAKSSGFCSKCVRISSNKHHHIELAASLGASPLASAGSFASKSKGFLKSISSRPAARRRFTNEIRIARRAMSRFFSFAVGERQSEILLNYRCAFPFSITIKK
jgi:hypothetical protein